MSEAIPLRPTLSIQFVLIIICNTLDQSLNLVLEAFPSESRNLGMVQW